MFLHTTKYTLELTAFKGNLSSREIQANETLKYVMEGLQKTLTKVLSNDFSCKKK